MESGGGSGFLQRQYQAYTRYLRPVRAIQFSDLDMLKSMIQILDPEEISSVSQLLGPRRGVVRITCKTMNAVERLEEVVRTRKLMINGVPLGQVEESTGQFILVVLDNVPQYITDEQVEEAMSKYGTVASSSKDYVELNGCRIENERRNVQFTALFNREIVRKGDLRLFGTTVFVKAPYLELGPTAHAVTGFKGQPDHQGGEHGDTGTNSSESKTSNALSALIDNVGGIIDRASTRPADPYQRTPVQTRPPGMSRRAAHRLSYHPGAASDLSEMLGAHSLRLSPPSARSTSQEAEGHGGRGVIIRDTGPGNLIKPMGVGPPATRQMRKRSEAFEQLSAFLQ